MCPATSPSHSDMNQHCHVSTDLLSFPHRAVFNPKVSSFVAFYSNIKSALEISAASSLALSFQCSDSPYQCICPNLGCFLTSGTPIDDIRPDYASEGDRAAGVAVPNGSQLPSLKVRHPCDAYVLL